jgi:hypothetical protein
MLAAAKLNGDSALLANLELELGLVLGKWEVSLW